MLHDLANMLGANFFQHESERDRRDKVPIARTDVSNESFFRSDRGVARNIGRFDFALTRVILNVGETSNI